MTRDRGWEQRREYHHVPDDKDPAPPDRGLGMLEAEWVRGADEAAVEALTDIVARHPHETNELFAMMQQDPRRGLGFSQQVAERIQQRAAASPTAPGSQELLESEAVMKLTLLPAEQLLYGNETRDLWAEYLARSPGDPLVPHLFAEGSPIAEAFKQSAELERDQQRLLRKVAARLEIVPHIVEIPPNEWTVVSLEQLLGPGPVQRDISFTRGIPGNIAGGVGASDAGADGRSVTGNVRVFRETDASGAVVQTVLESDFHYVVSDAIDFVPGNLGGVLERDFTIPLRHLEETGHAYDVAFQVVFDGPTTRLLLPAQAGGPRMEPTTPW